MGRPAKFSSDEILDTTARLVAEGGPASATVSAIAEELGAPTGSIYHRFESRDLVLARLWIRTIKEAQAGFTEALTIDDAEEAAIAAALHLPRWCRRHLDHARFLLLHRREELIERWPRELGKELRDLNRDVEDALRTFTVRLLGDARPPSYRKAAFALVDVPYGAVRRYLIAGKAPPRTVDDLVRRTCTCILGIS